MNKKNTTFSTIESDNLFDSKEKICSDVCSLKEFHSTTVQF